MKKVRLVEKVDFVSEFKVDCSKWLMVATLACLILRDDFIREFKLSCSKWLMVATLELLELVK